MKYKVGDKVRIKIGAENKAREIGISLATYNKLKGKIYTIKEVNCTWYRLDKGGRLSFIECMLESIVMCDIEEYRRILNET